MKQLLTHKHSFLLALTLLLFPGKLMAQGAVEGMLIGPNYIVWEAEATTSPLDQWELIVPGDERYYDNGIVPPIGETHLEFTGNDHNTGPATSPLDYTFTCPKTGTYRLGARLYQRLDGQPEDKCNDVYIRMAGNFTSGNHVTTHELEENQKFYGRGVDEWGALYNLEAHTSGHAAAIYKLTKDSVYTLTVSGRAQRTNIDYWLLYETTLPIILEAHQDLAAVNPEEYRPPATICKEILAIDMKYTDIEGFTDAQTDFQAGLDILQIPDRLEWAAAQYIFQGTEGQATFTLNTMLERDGESTYRVLLNDSLLAEVTNDTIFGTSIPDYTIQSHIINDTALRLSDGDTLQVEFCNATNGLVPEGETTATSRGRWVSLDICTNGRFTNFAVDILKGNFSLPPGDSLDLEVEALLPHDYDSTISWISRGPSVATVDQEGMVKGLIEGTSWIVAGTSDGKYMDSLLVTVITPQPFGGEPHAIPGLVEAEDYDIGGEGATYHDSDPGNSGGSYRPDEGVDVEACSEGGFNVGWTVEDEWLKYTIQVTDSGNYYFEIRVASESASGAFHVELNEEDITGTTTFSSSGGWQNWKTVRVDDLAIDSGQHTLKVYYEADAWNFNWFRMYLTGTIFDVTAVSINPESFTLRERQSRSLSTSVLPDNATDNTVSWSSLDPGIASVNENGLVTGVSIGETTIIAETNDGGYSAMSAVTVVENTAVQNHQEDLASIYPNPFTSEFTIVPSSSINIRKVVLRNYAGQISYEQEVYEKGNIHVSLSEIASKGIYLVELIGDKQVQTLTVIAE